MRPPLSILYALTLALGMLSSVNMLGQRLATNVNILLLSMAHAQSTPSSVILDGVKFAFEKTNQKKEEKNFKGQVRAAPNVRRATSSSPLNFHAQQFARTLQRDGDSMSARSFPECLEQKLSPKACQDYIEHQIKSAGGHEVGPVNVKIQVPRTQEIFDSTYWMIEVPVSIDGKVACDRNNGQTFYPYRWKPSLEDAASAEPTDDDILVHNVNCLGLNAGECCLAIRNYGRTLTESGYDHNQQCLSCFVHQEPLEPVLNVESGHTDYLDHVLVQVGEEKVCEQEQMNENQIDLFDEQTMMKINKALAAMEYFNSSRSCTDFDELLKTLYNAASVIPPLSEKIGNMACSICYGKYDHDNMNDAFVTALIEDILLLLGQSIQAKINSKENCIIIYTNTDGDIVKVPQLGASRSDEHPPSRPVVEPLDVSLKEEEDDDEVEITCLQDETICDRGACTDVGLCEVYCNDDSSVCDPESEFCARRIRQGFPIYICVEDPCKTDPPVVCHGSDEICKPNPSWLDGTIAYACTSPTCIQDPTICGPDQICAKADPHVDYSNAVCIDSYAEIGEECDLPYKLCDPSVAYCALGTTCIASDEFDRYYYGSATCTAYGEGSCTDDNGVLTQDNCKSDEYCASIRQGRCKRRVGAGECCEFENNNCGLDPTKDDGSYLVCAEQIDLTEVGYYYYHIGPKSYGAICQSSCDTDEDCDENQWCATSRYSNDSDEDTRRFCRTFKAPSELCMRGITRSDGSKKGDIRCDPHLGYCYDAGTCNLQRDFNALGGTFDAYCIAYETECKHDDDCDAKEWCDDAVGYCKIKHKKIDCCWLGETVCQDGLTCQPVSDLYEFKDFHYYHNPQYYQGSDASICFEP